ncbi:nucleotide exchange factor GrpE [Candidatus Manganitrophus noduliformans]|uniref:Protein GrpE n=1 Tax=Candidatus Manganitrophus noduliformans TaxID=2606439 RepID=A0A7X6DL71_9BACT|nr:nucleotide exchange factor GrpE [Candidatus Manganitrophus noduliformans]NKE69172.1 nucleotide exchange factor GrpE [Candidatus Manganitrophus noduliformans]
MNQQDENKIGEEKERFEEAKGPATAEDAPAESPEKVIETLRAGYEKKEEEARQAQERFMRTLADFENYKKRAQRDQSDALKYANEKLIKELLPVIDNLERALAHSRETRDFDRMMEGVELIRKQLLSALGKFGVAPIESLNHPFDPSLHQSIGQIEVEEGSDAEENQVIGETQKGYHLNDRVLRPSLVMIAKKKAPPSGDGAGAGEGI